MSPELVVIYSVGCLDYLLCQWWQIEVYTVVDPRSHTAFFLYIFTEQQVKILQVFVHYLKLKGILPFFTLGVFSPVVSA